MKILFVVGSSIFIGPSSGKIKKVISNHIEKRPEADGGAEEIWPLRNCGPYEKPGV